MNTTLIPLKTIPLTEAKQIIMRCKTPGFGLGCMEVLLLKEVTSDTECTWHLLDTRPAVVGAGNAQITSAEKLSLEVEKMQALIIITRNLPGMSVEDVGEMDGFLDKYKDEGVSPTEICV